MTKREALPRIIVRSIRNILLWQLTVLAVCPISSGRSLVERKLDEYLVAATNVWRFQGAVLVAKEGKVILRKGYGMANREVGVSNTPETKFFIGSITKQFTAAAILLLQQDGLLNVMDPISMHLPDYPGDAGSRIKLHHLLTHTSGIPDYTQTPSVMLKRTTALSQTDLLRIFDQQPLEFEPGTQFRYSNSGYVVLGAIIERVSGQSYEAFLHHRLLKPLKMLNSGYARREMGLPDRADGYTLNDDQGLIRAPQVDPPLLHSAGALYSTVDDMLLWDKALRDHSILDKKYIEVMLALYTGFYGYGWFIETLYGRRHTFHGGYLDGFNTTFDRWIDDNLCIVVFSNEDEAPVKKIARNLAAIVFGEPYNVPRTRVAAEADSSLISEYTGVYGEGDESHVVYTRDKFLFDRPYNEPARKLLPFAADSFFVETDNTITLLFTRDEMETVVGCVLDDDGMGACLGKLTGPQADSIWVFKRAIALDPDVLGGYVGKYRLETGVEGLDSTFYVEIVLQRNGLSVIIGEGEAVDVFPYTQSEFFNYSADFLMQFIADSAGSVTACRLELSGASVTAFKSK